MKKNSLEISTNIFNKLSDDDREDIKKILNTENKDLKISEYSTKAFNTSEITNFIIHDFDALKFFRDGALWSLFISLLKKFIEISKKRTNKSTIDVWIIDKSPAMNISFSISETNLIILEDLRNFIEKHTEIKKEENEIIYWISYNREKQEWNLIEL